MAAQGQTRIRVVHVTEAAGGGVRVHLRRIVPGLRERGVEVDLILSPVRAEHDLSDDLDAYRELGCRVELCRMAHGPAPVGDWSAVGRVRRLLREWAPGVVHLHATKAGLLGRLAAAPLRGVRTVYSPHAFCFEGFPAGPRRWLAVRLERWLVRKTDRFVFVSEAEKEVAARVLSVADAQTCVVENGLPADFGETLLGRAEARGRWGIPDDAVAAAVPGRLAHQKGQDWLLRALARLDLRDSGLRFHFFGEGPDEAALRREAMRLGLDPFVSWLGYAPDFRSGLRAFDMVVLPSRYEGLSYALLEALAAGVPVVVSEIAAHLAHEAIRDHVAVAPLEDEQALAGAIAGLAKDRGRREAVAARSAEFMKTHFTLSAQVDGLAACYREVRGG